MSGRSQAGARGRRIATTSVDGEAEAARRLEAVVARLQEETVLWQEFMRAHRTIVDLMAEQMMRDHNLPLEWFDVLIHLADVPGGSLRQRVLRDRLLLSESGVSRLLVRMESAGLIARSPADDDRRGMAITLTDRGRSALLEATASHLELVASLFTDRLTRTDQSALTRVLPKLSAPLSPAASAVNGDLSAASS
jgi:DNA-binding MarR family transcriptional regulator